MESQPSSDIEEKLRESWSIGPLRPWLKVLAERQLPAELKGKLDASDIVQQTLIDAWRGQQDYRGTTERERLAWMRVILTRVIVRNERDLLKTKKRGEGRERQLQAAIDRTSLCIEHLAIGKDPDPQSAAALTEQTLALASALQALPDDYRRVLLMRHFDGKSHAEIALKIGKTEPASRMIWVRALAKLRQIFTARNPQDASRD